ncbi:MAG: ATPase domain-containing protein [Candidatus Hodarchaeota archaeon]
MDISETLEINKHQIVNKSEIIKQFEKEKNRDFSLSSGAKKFDEVLGGGFRLSKKYLIFGANKTGKTQLCHQLCVQAYNQFSKFFKTSTRDNRQFIYYFDTENTFRPERLKELKKTSDIEYKKILKTILVSKIMSNSALLLVLKELENIIDLKNISILIIDTINNHYNSELADKRISSVTAKKTFLEILKKINYLSKNCRLITIATAQVTSKFTGGASIRVLPIGHHLLNHYFSEYIHLDYKSEDKRYVHLVNSLILPEKRLLYQITSTGIQDYKF